MKKAFTLIELLIVVAIIAILAAIAVPNFLEAQTRAKVARILSDQRTYATALETYMIDHSTYLPYYTALNAAYPEGRPLNVNLNINGAMAAANNVTGDDLTKYRNLASFAYKQADANNPPLSLTSPVSYLNTYVPDTYATTKGMTFGYVMGPAGFLLWSPGPDGVDQLWFTTEPGGAHKGAEHIMHGGHSQPSPYLIGGPLAKDAPSGAPTSGKAYTYDASNGTNSDGDVYRTK